jgi:hypothetical protein
MCELSTFMTVAASAATKVIDVTQQLQRAQAQRNDYDWLAAQQRSAAAVDERARRRRCGSAARRRASRPRAAISWARRST